MPTTKHEAKLAELHKLRRRIPKFNGVRRSADGEHWTAAVRSSNGKRIERVIGDKFASEVQAYRAYLNARPPSPLARRKGSGESIAHVERVMAISEGIPVTFETEASLYGSCMDPTSQDWQLLEPMCYETRGAHRKR
jgi:hypothetical protein